MMSLMRLIRAELLKLKNTPLVAVAVWVAIMPAAMVALIYLTQNGDQDTIWKWDSFVNAIMQIWLQLIMTLFIGAIAAQYLAIEHSGNAWKVIFSTPVSKGSVVIAKWCITVLLVVISFIVLIVTMYAGAAILQLVGSHAELMPQAFDYLSDDMVMIGATFVAALGIMTIQYILAFVVRMMSVPIIVAVAGFMAATMAAGRELLLHLLPWAWPYQVYLQTIDSPNAGVSIPYALIASVVVSLVGLCGMVLYIRRRDEL